MPHKLLLSVWATSLALAFTSAANSKRKRPLQPYAPPILHTFLDSANVVGEKHPGRNGATIRTAG